MFSYTPQSISYIIKDSSCFLNFHFLTLSHPYAETLLHLYELRWMGGDDIMEKAFTWRFGFDSVESRKFTMSVKNKATVNVSWVCFFVLLYYIGCDNSYNTRCVYTYRREAFALLVSTDRAMRKPNRVKRATSGWLHAFLCIKLSLGASDNFVEDR